MIYINGLGSLSGHAITDIIILKSVQILLLLLLLSITLNPAYIQNLYYNSNIL